MSRIAAIAVLISNAFMQGPASNRRGLLYAAEPAGAASADKRPVEPKWPSLTSDNNAYLAELRQLQGELDRFRDNREWRDSVVQFIGTQQSFVGRYRDALTSFDDRPDANAAQKAVDLAEYEACDAVETILELANRHQVIMINEAHHVPLHRAFTISLLAGLYKQGFRYFAAEALTAGDTALAERGYPTLRTGYYLHEPLCADLVRIGLELGYQVVPYEFEGPEQRKEDDAIDRQNTREEGQARHLHERILAKDPQAKILVHAGYGHIQKLAAPWELGDKQREVRLMASCFQRLTGIEPLCIDQTHFTEHSAPKFESPIYRQAIEQGLLKDAPIVLRLRGCRAFLASLDGTDLAIFHPRTRYEHGRPNWLSLGGRRQPHVIQIDLRPAAGALYLAQAFYAHEQGPNAVPIDQSAYSGDEPLPTLWLPEGKFGIRIINESGKTQREYSTVRE
jgi:hypothetical protein